MIITVDRTEVFLSLGSLTIKKIINNRRRFYKILMLSAFLLFADKEPAVFGLSEISEPPVITRLDYSDLNYRQLQQDIEYYYRADASGKKLPPLVLYTYHITDDENIFSIASKAGLPYETVATLNRIPSSSTGLKGRTILLPGRAGMFIPVKPESDLEYIALSWRLTGVARPVTIQIPSVSETDKMQMRSFYYFQGASFHNVERAYFLGILFSNPIPDGIVSSGYGMRQNPFTGHKTFHNGIDIAAPEGTPVYAAREGEVIARGNSEIFGNYLEIKHEGGYSTFYGHLNKFFVELHDHVNSTMIIAEVGNTGKSTGPHLHFEIRKDGSSRDPADLTPGLQ